MAFSLQDLMGQFAGLGGGQPDVTSFLGGSGSGAPSLDLSGVAGASAGAGGLGSLLGGGGGMAAFAANPALGAGLMGLQALSGLFQGNKQFKLAKDQFKFQKQIANANLNNSIKSYNNTLEDRLNARGVMEGRDAASVQEEIDRKRLSR